MGDYCEANHFGMSSILVSLATWFQPPCQISCHAWPMHLPIANVVTNWIVPSASFFADQSSFCMVIFSLLPEDSSDVLAQKVINPVVMWIIYFVLAVQDICPVSPCWLDWLADHTFQELWTSEPSSSSDECKLIRKFYKFKYFKIIYLNLWSCQNVQVKFAIKAFLALWLVNNWMRISEVQKKIACYHVKKVA